MRFGLDPDLILPEPRAKLFRCRSSIAVPAGNWNLIVSTLIPIREGERLLGYGRIDDLPVEALDLCLVIDYESMARLDIEIGKHVYPWALWLIDTEANGPQTLLLKEIILRAVPQHSGQPFLSGEIL